MLEQCEVDASVIEMQGKTDDTDGRDKTDGIGRAGTKRNRAGNHDKNGQINRDGNGEVHEQNRQVSLVHDTGK